MLKKWPPPGLRYRQQERDELKEAADSGSTQAKLRLPGAESALKRQQKVATMRGRIGRPRAY